MERAKRRDGLFSVVGSSLTGQWHVLLLKITFMGPLKFPCPEGELDTWTLTKELLRADQNQRPVN